jgi:hypothetical protein
MCHGSEALLNIQTTKSISIIIENRKVLKLFQFSYKIAKTAKFYITFWSLNGFGG